MGTEKGVLGKEDHEKVLSDTCQIPGWEWGVAWDTGAVRSQAEDPRVHTLTLVDEYTGDPCPSP